MTGSSAAAAISTSVCGTSAVCSSCSVNVPSSIARASSITCWKLFSDATARGGTSCRFTAWPMAPHIESPVSRANCSSVSIVPLPMPRVGVLITRNNEIVSSGF